MPLLLLNKPYRVLSQFSGDDGRTTLRDYVTDRTVYPAGRLDYDSEGLLALTDDGQLQSKISHRRSKLPKHYWVQIEGNATAQQLLQLTDGVTLKDGNAAALTARRVDAPAGLWPRDPPIRFRKTVPDCWVEIVVDEGRNRQVRRMTAAIGLPALRLIRHRIGPWSLGDLAPGEITTIELGVARQTLDAYKAPRQD